MCATALPISSSQVRIGLCWDTDPPEEVDCALPTGAQLIGEAEFRLLVLKTHGLVE
jgi:hypothetical protein